MACAIHRNVSENYRRIEGNVVMNKLNNKKISASTAVHRKQFALLSLGLLAGLAQAQSALEAGAIAGKTGGTVVAQAAQPGQKSKAAPKKTAAAITTAAAPKGRAMEGPNCSGDAILPQKLVLPLGKSTLVHLPEAVANRAVGNPDIVKAMLMSPQTLYLLGVDIGMTNMIIQGRSGSCTAIDVVVSMDPAGLQSTLTQLMPEEKNIKVSAAADTLVMTGSVEDATAVSRAMELANAFVRRPTTAVHSGAPEADGKPGAAAKPAGAAAGGQTRVVNLLSVSAPQQVMLEVKVAEVSKTLLDKLGVGATVRTTSGSWAYTLLSNFLTGTAGGLLDATKTNGSQVTLEAEKRDGLVKILAEPTVMAISGQEGSFLAGGKILIPVGQSNNNGTTTITLEEKEFGVGLKFTPTVLAGGRINLRVAPEVSELSREGVGITAAGITGTSILPLITTRRASTTVQLFDGQSFAIGGLIKNNTTANIKGLPLLGEVPVLGALFRSTDFQQDKTELLFVVTPRLVKPLPPNYALPTDNVADPSRAELFLGGRLEGSNPPPQPTAPLIERNQPPSGPSGFELK
jgi:pilus assembly protein CpaC